MAKMTKKNKMILWAAIIFILLFHLGMFLAIRSFAETYFPSEKRREQIRETFDALPHTDGYAIRNGNRLVVKDTPYKDVGIIIYMDADGFYSYTHTCPSSESEEPSLSFFHTRYDDMESELLGTAALPSTDIPTDVKYYDGNVYYTTSVREERGETVRYYYRWNVNDKEAVRTTDYDDYLAEQAKQNESDYDFEYDGFIWFSAYEWFKRVKVTEKSTGIQKTVDKKTLKSFPEGKRIYRVGSTEEHIFAGTQLVSNGDIYFLLRCTVGIMEGDADYYYYIFKWNFQTEESTFITTVEGLKPGADEFFLIE